MKRLIKANTEIINIAKENNFYEDIINFYKDCIFEKDNNGNWCYPEMHHSGRDFYDYIPLSEISEFKNEDIFRKLNDKILYDLGIEDYDWQGIDIDTVIEELDTNFLNYLIDQLLAEE